MHGAPVASARPFSAQCPSPTWRWPGSCLCEAMWMSQPPVMSPIHFPDEKTKVRPEFQPISGLSLDPSTPGFPFPHGRKDAHLLVLMGILLRFAGHRMELRTRRQMR